MHSGTKGGSIHASQVSSQAVLQCGDSGQGKRENGENNYVYYCREVVLREMRVEEKDFQGQKLLKGSVTGEKPILKRLAVY